MLQVALGVALLAFFFKWINIWESRERFARIAIAPFALTCVLGLVGTAVRGLRFYVWARAVKAPVTLVQSVVSNYIASLFALVTPARVGEGGKVLFFAEKRELAAGFVCEKLADLGLVLLAGTYGAFVFRKYVNVLLIVAALLTLGAVLLFNLERVLNLVLRRHIFDDGWLWATARQVRSRSWALFGLCSFGIWSLGIFAQIVGARALGLIIPVHLMVQVSALTALAGALSGTPGGIGTSQWTFTTLIVENVGVDREVAGLLAILMLFATYLTTLLRAGLGFLAYRILEKSGRWPAD